MNKSIRICKMKKEHIVEHLEALSGMVSHPKYICSKCARAVNKKHNVCKAIKIH